MDWPYHFVDTTPAERHTRRILLDRYGVCAQLSSLIPIVIYQLYRLTLWVYASRRQQDAQYDAVPGSPTLKHRSMERREGWGRRWRVAVWWLQGDIGEGWGERGHWVAGVVWGVWLAFLCVHRTSDDYLHFTKRLGMIATSQFPLHYALSMKSRFSPLALLFRTSHTHLNPYHRISGRIIYTLVLLHGIFYMNFFIQSNLLASRLTSLIVWIGIIALASMTILMSTSLQAVRRRSYRLFFILHLTLGVSVLPLLFFHASPLRVYVSEAWFLFLFDISARKLDTFTSFATITPVAGTELVRISIPIPSGKIARFKKAPGQHVYLQIPQQSVPISSSSSSLSKPPQTSKYLYELLFNPFTVAAVSDTHIELVIRVLSGPSTLALQKLASMNKAKPPLNIEGPLGASSQFPNLEAYDRVLLVAGGVGATFAVPVYRALKEKIGLEGGQKGRVRLVWCVRNIAETSWAFRDSSPSSSHTESPSSLLPESPSSPTNNFSLDDSISIYVTSSRIFTNSTYDAPIELDNLSTAKEESGVAPHEKGRPDLRSIVHETFKHRNGERVAVLVCGPRGLAAETRRLVGSWVEKGREVWFWEEGFGW